MKGLGLLITILGSAAVGYLFSKILQESKNEEIAILVEESKVSNESKLQALEKYLKGEINYDDFVKMLGFTPEEARKIIEEKLSCETPPVVLTAEEGEVRK